MSIFKLILSSLLMCLLLVGSSLAGQVYSPGNGVTPPHVVRGTPMPRPASDVILECVIEADGRLTSPKVVRSGGTDDDAAVLGAITQWQFEAGTKDGSPVAVRFYLHFPRSR